MAYRSPALIFLHALRTAGAASVTVSNEQAGFTKERLLDDRGGAPFRFNTTAANHFVSVDRGAATTGDERIDRLIIPAGHNLSGASVEVLASTTGAFGGEETTEHSFTAAAGVIDESFTAVEERYVRLNIVTSGQWEFGELVFSKTRAPTRGLEVNFADPKQANYVEATMVTRETYRTVRGPAQRAFLIAWPFLDDTDRTIFDDWDTETLAGARTFWFLSPDDADTVLPMKLVDFYERENASPNPTATGIRPTVRMSLLEAIE